MLSLSQGALKFAVAAGNGSTTRLSEESQEGRDGRWCSR
jgi:hypothetical protein